MHALGFVVMSGQQRKIYQSENGDGWWLCREEGGCLGANGWKPAQLERLRFVAKRMTHGNQLSIAYQSRYDAVRREPAESAKPRHCVRLFQVKRNSPGIFEQGRFSWRRSR